MLEFTVFVSLHFHCSEAQRMQQAVHARNMEYYARMALQRTNPGVWILFMFYDCSKFCVCTACPPKTIVAAF